MSKLHRRSECPISFALDVFGDKWSLLIMRDMLFEGKSTYHEFLAAEEGIATNILTNRLRMLEERGVITAMRNGRRRTYRLTDRGIDLLPTLIELTLWSAMHDPDAGSPDDFTKAAMRDKVGFIRRLKKGIKSGHYYCS
jgi:DNA-binding HxlR family transcriptional regulator